MSTCPAQFSSEVRPLLSPTVETALIVSYSASVRFVSITSNRRIVKVMTIHSCTVMIAVAFLIRPAGILLLRITTSSWSLRNARRFMITMKTVTVFTPPAVPRGDPPINISKSSKRQVASESPDWDTEENPAVLAVVDWKTLFRIFCHNGIFPSVSGLLYSQIKITSPPSKTMAVVSLITRRVWTLIWRREYLTRADPSFTLVFTSFKSVQTTYPRPPIMISIIVVIKTSGLLL